MDGLTGHPVVMTWDGKDNAGSDLLPDNYLYKAVVQLIRTKKKGHKKVKVFDEITTPWREVVLERGYSVSPVSRYYEIDGITAEAKQDLHFQGIGFTRHNAAFEEDSLYADTFVTFVSESQARKLMQMGYDLHLPSKAAFSKERWEEITTSPFVTLTESEIVQAEFNPYKPVFVGYNHPLPMPYGDNTKFCQFDEWKPGNRCSFSISEELEAIEETYPEKPGYGKYVKLLWAEERSFEDRKIYAVRIGRFPDQDVFVPAPAVIYNAGQHAREWAATEVAMSMIRYYAEAIRDGNTDIMDRLSNKALVVVPVANPDGYQFSHTPGNQDRSWRKNRNTDDANCSPPYSLGVDLNRNHKYTWYQPGSSTNCGGTKGDIYRGAFPESESETRAQKDIVFNMEEALNEDGRYYPVIAIDAHSYGNYVLWPDGIGTDAQGQYCNNRSNCMLPDFVYMRELLGSQDSPLDYFNEPYSYQGYASGPYETNGGFRGIYEVSGSMKGEMMFGHHPGYRNPISFTLELTYHKDPYYSFYAEHFDSNYMANTINNQIGFVEYLLENLDDIDSSAFALDRIGVYGLPAIERRCYDQQNCWETTPKLYVAVHKMLAGKVNVQAAPGFPGIAAPDLPGYLYNLIRWNPSVAFQFPSRLTVCDDSGYYCETILVDRSSWTEEKLWIYATRLQQGFTVPVSTSTP